MTIKNAAAYFLNYNNSTKSTMQQKKSQQKHVDQKEAIYKPCIIALLLFLLIPFTYYLYLQRSQATEDQFLADQITFVVIASGRVDLLDQTIGSLLSSQSVDNQSKFMVIYDGNKTEDIQQYIRNQYKIVNSNFPFEWIITESVLGELACIDLAFSKVKTKYAFLSLGNWQFSKKNFIEPAIKAMKKDKRVSQVVVTQIMGLLEKNVQKLTALDTPAYGFILLPSLHQIKAYRKIPGGLSNLTFNATYGCAAGVSELIISQFFSKMRYHIQILNQSFAQKILAFNPVYKTLQFQDRYGYLGSWKVPESQKWICRLMLKIGNSLMLNYKLYKLERKRINKLLRIKNQQLKIDYEKYGFSINIQIGSQFDYIGVMGKKQFSQIVQNFPKTLYYQTKPIWNVKKDVMKNQVLQRKIKFSKINTSESFHKFLQNKNISSLNLNRSHEDAIKLGVTLLSKSNDLQALEAEYFFYYHQAKLEQKNAESKICVFLSGQNLMSRVKMNNLLQSINRQNYSNYQFVVSVDKNSDQSMSRIFEIIEAYYPKLFNRLKVALYNEEKLGHSGNHYVRMKQFCRGSQIVLNLNGNSTLIGRQAFNVINSLFKDSDNWITFFSPIIQKNLTFGFSDMNIKGKNLRLTGLSTDQYLVAFRFEIVDLLPISQVMQLKYDLESGELHPNFIQSESNDFHIYSYCQMSGQSRIRYYQSYPIYHYNQLEKKESGCNQKKEDWQKMKARIRYPLNKLASLNDTPTVLNMSYEIPNQVLTQISSFYENFKNCQKTAQIPVNATQFNFLLQDSLSKMVSPDYYMPVNQDIKIQQMPFCFVVDATVDQDTFNKIIYSIKQQNYDNYTLLVVQRTNAEDFKFESKKKEQIEMLNIALPNKSHQSYRYALRKLCIKNSLVMFLNQPLIKNVILQLNRLHQRQNSWMTYSKTDIFVQINSIYLRVYELVQFNDFDRSNQKYLFEGDQQLITLIILQLCSKFSSHNHYQTIYQVGSTQQYKNAYLRAQIMNHKLYQRSAYQHLFTLQQDYFIDFQKKEDLQKKFYNSHLHSTKPSINSFIRKSQFFKAFEYDQIPYIPDNHYLNQRQFRELERKFKISEFMYDPKKQLRFCLTIFGRNNTQFGRYWKILETIKMQNYENYHIVFLDDNSDDKTLELSMQYFNKINFPREKLTFIKNSKRVYATYNIINSAFNYCHQDDIQVRFDGDDFMLGRHVFNLFNTFYQRNPDIWVAYTNYKSNDYTYGLASDFSQAEQLMNCMGTFRRRIHFITPITTWRVKLIRAIPLKYHQREPGIWLNTLYDDALQFSFVELATLDRIKYIPYINYHYNQNYGSNDNSNEQKERERVLIFRQVIYYEPLDPMKSLDDPRVTNHKVIAELLKDRKNKVFQQIKR